MLSLDILIDRIFLNSSRLFFFFLYSREANIFRRKQAAPLRVSFDRIRDKFISSISKEFLLLLLLLSLSLSSAQNSAVHRPRFRI